MRGPGGISISLKLFFHLRGEGLSNHNSRKVPAVRKKISTRVESRGTILMAERREVRKSRGRDHQKNAGRIEVFQENKMKKNKK